MLDKDKDRDEDEGLDPQEDEESGEKDEGRRGPPGAAGGSAG